MALQRVEIIMISWMCGAKVTEKLETNVIIEVLQPNRLRRYEHGSRNDEMDWVKNVYKVKGVRLRGRPKKTQTAVMDKDCRTRQLIKEDAMNCSKCRKFT